MTIGATMKKYMDEMPDTLKTKKEIDEYYKDAMKKSIEKSKQDIIDKPKKELTGYQKFVKDNSKSIKEQNPNLTGPQVFSKIAEMWKKQKETIVPNEESEDKKETDVDDNVSIDEVMDVKEVTKGKSNVTEDVTEIKEEEVKPEVVVKDGKKKKR
jgi:hypothetical protein